MLVFVFVVVFVFERFDTRGSISGILIEISLLYNNNDDDGNDDDDDDDEEGECGAEEDDDDVVFDIVDCS